MNETEQQLDYIVHRDAFQSAIAGLTTLAQINSQFARDCERKYFELKMVLENVTEQRNDARSKVELRVNQDARIEFLKTLIPDKVKKEHNIT